MLEDRKALMVNEDNVLDNAQRETELMLERTGLTHLLGMPEDVWSTVPE